MLATWYVGMYEPSTYLGMSSFGPQTGMFVAKIRRARPWPPRSRLFPMGHAEDRRALAMPTTVILFSERGKAALLLCRGRGALIPVGILPPSPHFFPPSQRGVRRAPLSRPLLTAIARASSCAPASSISPKATPRTRRREKQKQTRVLAIFPPFSFSLSRER